MAHYNPSLIKNVQTVYKCSKEEAIEWLQSPCHHSFMFRSGEIYDARPLNKLINS
jgi:hypothetical protein